jgi:LysM repeat protein
VFRAAQRDYGAGRENDADEMRTPPPPPPMPQIRPGDMPRKRKKPPAPVREERVKKPPNPAFEIIGKIMYYRINPLYISIAGWLVAVAAAAGIIFWFGMNMFVDNSFAVYLDDELIGYIALNERTTSESFHGDAVAYLEMTHGNVRAFVEQTVTIQPARVSSREISSHNVIHGLLTRKFDYTISATAIYVNGNFEALMRTQTCLEYLKAKLFSRWLPDNGEIMVRAEFIGDWEEKERLVNPDPQITEFTDAMQAFNRLDRPTMQMYPYTVVSGDNLGRIALRFDTDINRIMQNNNLTSHNIFPGDVLQIYTSRPLLSVRTYNEIPTTEDIPMPVETRENPDLPSHAQNIIQYGSSGVQETRELIIRENGVERSRETLEAVIIKEPIVHIIEQGVGSGSMEIR